jgi:hypothetical protein
MRTFREVIHLLTLQITRISLKNRKKLLMQQVIEIIKPSLL